jgi:sugar lactone lactonase YvrE
MKKIAGLFLLIFSGFGILRCQTFDAVSTYAGNSSPGLVDGALGSAEFNNPYSICFDNASSTFYVADGGNNSIRKIRNGVVSTIAGNGIAGDIDAQGTGARLNNPCGICFHNGWLYIADAGNSKIKKMDTLGNVTTIAGTGVAGYQDGSVTSARFSNPFDVALDASNNIYVADYYNHCVRKISGSNVTTVAGVPTVSGNQTGAALSARFNRPRSLCFDAAGNLYISDMINNEIKVLTTGGMVNLVAGSGAQGSMDGTGTGATFYHPFEIRMDMFGNILAADGGNYKIRRITPAGVVTSVIGSGSVGMNNAAAASATFNTPVGLCSVNGNLYITDIYNNLIRFVDISDVGMNEYSSGNQFTFFPNPSSDQITIESVNFPVTTVSIFDLSGKLCRTFAVAGKPVQVIISVADLPSGEYLIEVAGENCEENGRLIKR